MLDSYLRLDRHAAARDDMSLYLINRYLINVLTILYSIPCIIQSYLYNMCEITFHNTDKLIMNSQVGELITQF